MKTVKSFELWKRLLFTILILVIYMVGRSLFLYRIDLAAMEQTELDSQNFMLSMISGDRYQYTLFALGIMPFMAASILIQIILALCSSQVKSRISSQKIERITFISTMILAVLFAISRAGDFVFLDSFIDEHVLRLIAVFEMTAGVAIIYSMVNFNKKKGIGGQIVLIVVNLLDNLITVIGKHTIEELRIPLGFCIGISFLTLIMENVVVRLPLQRVSIDNEYADKNYIAFKLNPIGSMPVVFATTVFLLPQLIVKLLLMIWEDNSFLIMLRERLTMSDWLGIGVYLAIILLLTVAFSFIMIAPGEIADRLQKGGDSIVGIYAGRKTKKYLRRILLALSLFSGTVMSGFMAFSFSMAMNRELPTELALLPTTAMILVGIIGSIIQEIDIYRKFDSYKFYI